MGTALKYVQISKLLMLSSDESESLHLNVNLQFTKNIYSKCYIKQFI